MEDWWLFNGVLFNAYAKLQLLQSIGLLHTKKETKMSNQVLKTLLYVMLGILQSIKIILGSFPDDKRAQDIITVLQSLIILIQDALETPEMWID